MKKPTLNPVFLKELRQLVRSRVVGWGLLVYPIVLFIATALCVAAERGHGSRLEFDLGSGHGIPPCIATGIILGIAICVLLPVYAAIKTTLETVNNRMGLEFITNLTPSEIISGKMYAAGLLMVVATAVSLPFFTLAYLLRGVMLSVVLAVPIALIFLGLATLALGMLVACQRRAVALRIVEIVVLILFGPVIYAAAGIVMLLLHELSGRSGTDPMEIARTVAYVFSGLVTAILICRAVAASMLAPPFLDASRPVRKTELVLFVLTAPLMFFNVEPWPFGWITLASLIGIRATCRPFAHPRSVAATAPRSFFGRLGGFLLSGSYASGLLFSIILAFIAWIPSLASDESGFWKVGLLYLQTVPVFVLTSAFALRSDTKRAHTAAFIIALVYCVFAQFMPMFREFDIISRKTCENFYGCLVSVGDMDGTGYVIIGGMSFILLAVTLSTAIAAFHRYRRTK